jgi:hypothetical protein
VSTISDTISEFMQTFIKFCAPVPIDTAAPIRRYYMQARPDRGYTKFIIPLLGSFDK